MMQTDLLSNHEIIFVIIAFIFSGGGFYGMTKMLPERIKKSIEEVNTKIDKLDSRMDYSDKSTQTMQIIQAKNEVKIDSIQNSQAEMKQSILEITRMLNKHHGA